MLDAKNTDLFHDLGLPQWLPNESVYSLISRYHRLSGHVDPALTSKILLGASVNGGQHDFPCGLKHFSKITKGVYGSIDSIIRNRTILPYFLPFKDKNIESDAFTAMRSPSIGSLKYRLGILTSRFGANHPLKICIHCREDDINKFGVPYWHLDHQYPGVWICLKHQHLLSYHNHKSIGGLRFHWILPDELYFHQIDNVSPQVKNHLTQLTKASLQFIKVPPSTFIDSYHLLNVYKVELGKRNLLKSGGNLRLNTLVDEYYSLSKIWFKFPGSNYIPGTRQDAFNQIGRLMRTPKTGTHPIRHLLIILWLFKSWENFWGKYEYFNGLSDSGSKRPKPSVSIPTLDKKAIVLDLVSKGGISISKAAIKANVDISTAVGWLSSYGINYTTRPKKVTLSIRQAIIKSLERGENKRATAKKHDLSVQTVSRIMRQIPGLQEKWLEMQFEIEKKNRRQEWSDLIHDYSSLGIKTLRLFKPATYAWLYRNDLAWLNLSKQKISKLPNINNTSVDWGKRDIAIANAIKKAALKLLTEQPIIKLNIPLLCNAVPELNAKIKRLSMLPVTQKTLIQLLKKPIKLEEDLVSNKTTTQ